MILNLNLGEMSTGELSFGFGYSSASGGFFQAAITEKNFLGKGQRVGLSANFAEDKNEYTFSFIEPAFLDMNLWAGYELSRITRDYRSTSGYKYITNGVAVKAGYSYTDYLSQSWKLGYRQDQITDIIAEASDYIQSLEGSKNVVSLSQTLSYDRRRMVGETGGYIITLGNEYAGFGSDENFLKTDIGFAYGKGIASWLSLNFSLNYGYIQPIADTVGTNYLYYLGGDSLRGFETRGIGSRDARYPYNTAYGGLWVAYGSLQFNFPLGIPKEWGIKGNVFYDFGTIGDSQIVDANLVYSDKIRTSVGFGVSWDSPIGALNFSWSRALTYDEYDLRETFRFSVGKRF
jgi:outer membrane protein insertion porin family